MAAEAGIPPIVVEVAHATPGKQVLRSLRVHPGTTLAQAIELSGIRDEFPGLEIGADDVGIFSRRVGLDHVLRPGDRVEIYRPLIADPKEVRRERARKKDG
jgi:putative ubiquitin-RnfH superfamily antitoxin RatB of RatAB toxin-antitoxin module